jgi:hypothetical protein
MYDANTKITYALGDKWLEREFKHVNLMDQRLHKRLCKTSYLIEGKASGSINQSCKGWKEAKGAYRLFSNEKFKAEEVYFSHHKETEKRIEGHDLVFCIQDTTALDFDSHIKTQGLGSISKAYTKHQMGLMVHSSLIVSKKGLPLGLSSQACWARLVREENAKEKARRKYRAPMKDKESYKWITALKETMHNVPKTTRVITLGDREADIFEFLWTAESLGSFYVIRNRAKRNFICTKASKTTLQSALSELPADKEITVEVPRKGNNKTRKANIIIKYMQGFIPVRICSAKERGYKTSDKLAIYVVSAKEIDPPKGVEAIDWTLLTNVPVNSTLDAIERINWYKLRWKIEEYFRTLKSGCKIEDSRLSTKERLQKLIAIKSVIAFKILYLSKAAISHPQESCCTILTNDEWQALYLLEHQVNAMLDKPPNIKQAITWLGKLGGFMNRKCDNLPGPMTLWRGYENLRQSMTVLNILTTKNCG